MIKIYYSEQIQEFLRSLSDEFRGMFPVTVNGNEEGLINFIDVAHGEPDQWSYMDRGKIVNIPHYEYLCERFQTNECEYPCNVSGCRNPLPMEYMFEVWNPKGRIRGRVGRVIKRLIEASTGRELASHIIAEIVRRWDLYANGNNGYEYKLITGQEIVKAYYEGVYYTDNDGYMIQSCMRYKQCQPYLELYGANPDIIYMGTIWKGDKLGARAIVWGKQYYDRIYSANVYLGDLLRDYMEKEGMKGIWRTDLGNNELIKVQLSDKNVKYYPYLDTLYFYDPKTHVISNKGMRSPHLVLRNAGGSCEHQAGAICASCGNYIEREEDEVRLDNRLYCKGCIVTLDYEGRRGTRVPRSYCRVINGELYHRNDTLELYTGEYALRWDCVQLYGGSYALAGDINLVRLHNGYYDLKPRCELYHDKWYVKNQMYHLWTGEYVPQSEVREERLIRVTGGKYQGAIARMDDCRQNNQGRWLVTSAAQKRELLRAKAEREEKEWSQMGAQAEG